MEAESEHRRPVMEMTGEPSGENGSENQLSKAINGKKRKRPRKRDYYDKLCKQMEFYFSDANITKNRMMFELVTKSEFADLSVFLDFNKVKEITSNLKHLQKSLSVSKMLVLSPDLKGVKRRIPYSPTKIKSEEETEACTIYVENVPAHVNHEWLETIFQVFGPIAYISVPKFKHNGQPKGFAFVEFKTAEYAGRCLEAYGQEGACLSEEIDPSNLLSVKTFEGAKSTGSSPQTGGQSPSEVDEKSIDLKRRKDEVSISEPPLKKDKLETDSSKETKVEKGSAPKDEVKDTTSIEQDLKADSDPKNAPELKNKPSGLTAEDSSDSPSKRTRKAQTVHSSSVKLSPGHKRKFTDDNTSPKKGLNGSSTAAKLAKIDTSGSSSSSDESWTSDSSSDSDSSTSGEESSGEEKEGKSPKKSTSSNPASIKGKKKQRKRNKMKKTAEEKLESESIKLMVLPKRAWRQLRNRYLNLQRENMGKLKKQLKEQKMRTDHYKNFYNKSKETNRTESKVVKIELSTPAESMETFHRQITVELAESLGHACIQTYENKFFQFVDYKENELTAYIRLNGHKMFEECVDRFVEKAGRVFTSVRILTGNFYRQ